MSTSNIAKELISRKTKKANNKSELGTRTLNHYYQI